jgi:hypothetical protein
MYIHNRFAHLKAALLLSALCGDVMISRADTLMSLIDPQLPGVTQFDGWGNFVDYVAMTNDNGTPLYPGYPGNGTWLAPMESLVPGSGDAVIHKLANGLDGGPFPASASLYFGSFNSNPNANGGTISLTDTTPVANLKNVVLQIQIGPAYGYDFHNGVLPVLYYNGGNQALDISEPPTVLQEFDTGETMDGAPVYIKTYLMSWDLSAVLDPISSFAIQFTAVPHSQIYAMRLDQSDTLVPEPVGVSLMGTALILLIRFRRNACMATK